EGKSAMKGKHKRGNFGIFLTLVSRGQIPPGSVLNVEDVDRLSREEIDTAREQFRQILLAGVDIFTVFNWKLYTKASLNEPMELMEVIWRFYLAHQESFKKQERSRANWRKRKLDAQQGTLVYKSNRGIPHWLEYKDSKPEPIASRVKVI